jgi:hypothetical protein
MSVNVVTYSNRSPAPAERTCVLPLTSAEPSLWRSPVALLPPPLKLIGPPVANEANPSVILICFCAEHEPRYHASASKHAVAV